MNTSVALFGVIFGLVAMGIAIASLVCWILVLVKIFKKNIGLGILGLVFGLFAFIYGWIKVKEYKILSVMIIWSVCLVPLLFILPGLLFPAISNATSQAKMIRMANNGRQICLAVVSANVEREPLELPDVWPTTSYVSSTDYFKYLMGWAMNGTTPTTYTPSAEEGAICELSLASLAGAGVPCASGWAEFSSEKNAWCVVAQDEKGEEPNGETPFLITRNIEVTVQDGQVELQLTDEMPMGKRGGVIVTRDGSVMLLKQRTLRQYAQTLNPALLLHVLRP